MRPSRNKYRNDTLVIAPQLPARLEELEARIAALEASATPPPAPAAGMRDGDDADDEKKKSKKKNDSE